MSNATRLALVTTITKLTPESASAMLLAAGGYTCLRGAIAHLVIHLFATASRVVRDHDAILGLGYTERQFADECRHVRRVMRKFGSRVVETAVSL